jgi:CRISPR-associated protein Cmr5
MNRTLGQKRAHFALNFIKQKSKKLHENKKEKDKEKYLTLIRKAPATILQNGLGQLLAFWLADNEGKKGEDRKPSGILYDQLNKWLCGTVNNNDYPCRIYEKNNLIEEVMGGERHEYMRAQQEALALLDWMKKFAEAWLA